MVQNLDRKNSNEYYKRTTLLVYSIPYRPQGNGAVERVNKIITDFIKGLSMKDAESDKNLSKAIITYNNTWHSQIDISPSQYILTKAHERNISFR